MKEMGNRQKLEKRCQVPFSLKNPTFIGMILLVFSVPNKRFKKQL